MYIGPAISSQQHQLPSGYSTAPLEPPGEMDVASILATLLRRKRVFFAILVGFFSLVVLWTFLMPRSYTATMKLIAGASGIAASRSGDTALPLLNAMLAASSTQTAETYVDLMQENPVISQVARNLNLNEAKLLNAITVSPVTNTSIVELDVTWSDPQTAIKVANEFGKVFVERERDLIAGQAGSALDFLTKQLPVAEANMRKADSALAQFQAAHPGVYLGGSNDNQAADSAVFAAQQKFAQLQIDEGQAQAQLTNVGAQLSSTTPTINGSSNIVQNPVTAQLQTQLAQVDVQLASARKQFTEEHPTVQALKEQKAQIEREIRSQTATVVSGNSIVPNPVYQQLSQQGATLRTQIAGDQAQLKRLNGELGQLNGPLNSLPAASMQLANLQRKAKMAEDIYGALQQHYSEATVARTTALSDVSITQPATPDGVGVKPKWKVNLAVGFLLGLVLATSGVFVVNFFDNTFKDENDIQRTLALPLLTTVPQLTGSKPSSLPWLRALTLEAFQQLVTALRYSSDKPLRSLVITSPNQGDGKSTIAMSTAIAMAEIEPNVLLVDADLRRPTLNERFGLPGQPGLSDVVIGAASLAEAIRPTKYDGLYLLSSGTSVPNPVKLMHSTRFDELVSQLVEKYRIVIFDTPALMPVYDGAIIGSKVDGTVMVVSAGVTDLASTRKAVQRLASIQGVNLLGVVLNRATPSNGYQAYYLNLDNPTPLPHENEVASPS